ncbi:hypothetical protein GOBAR_DD30417 [Gossypium barbadense]|nr:hypothetical protein GOBAR_DD30417 [Gossypium barbadense]
MDRLPVWIHLKHVPLELFTRGGLSYIASALGNPLYMDGLLLLSNANFMLRMARELLLQLKFPGCLRNVVIVTITNEGDMMKSQLKTIATSSNSPDSTRNDVGLPSTSATSNVENDSYSNMVNAPLRLQESQELLLWE